MIDLPKKISATGNDCLVASVLMVCMYWRKSRQSPRWNIADNLDDQEWDKVYQKGLGYVKMSGMPTNNIKWFLNTLNFPLDSRLELVEDTRQLTNLLSLNIPPIVIYDRDYLIRSVHGIGHAVVLVDKTEEMLVSIDPSLHPKYVYKLPKTDFEEAWKFKQNATVIIYPKSYKIRHREIPSTTLQKWM
jgi:hypothetical protein